MRLFQGRTLRHIGGVSVVVVLLFAFDVPASDAAQPSRAEAARSLERQGKLTDALRAYGTPKPKTAVAKHIARLRVAIRALGAAALYARLNEYGRGLQVLRGTVRKLEPDRDVFIAAVLHRKIAAIAQRKREAADKEATETLSKAKALEDDDQHDRAAKTYAVVAKRPRADVSEDLIQQAKIGQLRAETAAETADEAAIERPLKWFWNTIEDAVKTIAKWAIYIGVALALILAAVALRREIRGQPPEKRTTVALEDLTASLTERTAKNKSLTRELITVIKSLGTETTEPAEAEIDETPDLDGTVLVNLAVVGSGLEEFEATIDDESPVKLGPISFNPRQVLSFGSSYFRHRSENELTGALVSFSDTSLLTVDLIGPNGGGPKKRWASTAGGSDARSKVIKEMASKIVLDLRGSQITSSWPSYRDYREAMDHLRRSADIEKRQEQLGQAKRFFQRSLSHDPANILARFNLSNVLRKQGDNEAAVEHYSFVEQIVREQNGEFRGSARELLLDRHPEFPYVVRYNRAVTRSKIDSEESHELAVAELEKLIDELERDPNEPTHLVLLTRAAWAAAQLYELEKLRREGTTPEWRKQQEIQRREIVEMMERVRDWVEHLPVAEPLLDWAAYVNARATVQSAMGRAYYLVGRYDEAYEAFERALSMADLGDAHIHMASLLMRRRERYPRWNLRAEEHLKDALTLSPHDLRARFMLGKLYADPVSNRLDEAKEQFGKVDDAWACFHLAQIHAKQNKLELAVEVLRRSLRLSNDPDYRSKLYLEYLLALNQKKRRSVSVGQLREALAFGERLVKSFTDAEAKARELAKKASAAGRAKEAAQKLAEAKRNKADATEVRRLLTRIRQTLARRKP